MTSPSLTQTPDSEPAPPNRCGAETAADLESFERRLVALRVAQLDTETFDGRTDYHPDFDRALINDLNAREFGLPYLRAIHAYIVQDVYDWGGQVRELGQESTAMGIDLAPSPAVAEILPGLCEEIRQERLDLDTPPDEVLSTVAANWSAMTYLHPFVDGNSRAQRVFFNEYLRDSGWEINWQNVDARAVHAARYASAIANDPTYLEAQLKPGLVGFADEAAQSSLPELTLRERQLDGTYTAKTFLTMCAHAAHYADEPNVDGYSFAAEHAATEESRQAKHEQNAAALAPPAAPKKKPPRPQIAADQPVHRRPGAAHTSRTRGPRL